jgi:hypothetical protein
MRCGIYGADATLSGPNPLKAEIIKIATKDFSNSLNLNGAQLTWDPYQGRFEWQQPELSNSASNRYRSPPAARIAIALASSVQAQATSQWTLGEIRAASRPLVGGAILAEGANIRL